MTLAKVSAFPTKTKELVHYKSHSGNDVFEVTNDLTKCQIPLYIIGADDKATKTDPITFETEELFLSGIAHIGGGRYFRISNESLLSYQNKIIGDVVKHDMSIENEEETVGELVKDALNRHFGDTNENQLAEDVLGNPRFNSSMFVQLLQNGRSLEPIDQVAKRIALSDDLDDAIETLEGIKKKKREQAVGNTRGSAVARMLLKFPAIEDEPCGSKSIHDVKTSTRGLNLSSHEKLDVGKLAKDVQDKVVLVKSNRTADLEMATRMAVDTTITCDLRKSSLQHGYNCRGAITVKRHEVRSLKTPFNSFFDSWSIQHYIIEIKFEFKLRNLIGLLIGFS
ncbi:hypothetical protein AC249_AIPGENE18216 [Exaiptasia diaphana]|nr:hypothetical protein AC249_AIPGENE18216 [Exaiptasia diaphana]